MQRFIDWFVLFWGGGNEAFWLLSLWKTPQGPHGCCALCTYHLGDSGWVATSCHCSCRGTDWGWNPPEKRARHHMGLPCFLQAGASGVVAGKPRKNRVVWAGWNQGAGMVVIGFLILAKAKAVSATKMCRIIRQGSLQNLILIKFHGF